MVTILGGDRYRIQIRRQALKNDFLVNNDPLALDEIDLETSSQLDLSTLLSLLVSTSLFYPRKLIILKHLSSRGDIKDQIEVICTKVSEDVDLVIIEPKLDTRTPFGQFLKKQSGYEEYPSYRGRELEDWLIEQARLVECLLSRPLAIYLIERVGTEALLLEQEIAKLRVHPVITRQLIDDLVVANPNSQIFDFLDTLMRGQLAHALALYQDQRQQKTDPLVILGLLVWQLRILIIVMSNKFSGSELTQEFALKPFVLQKARALTKGISQRHLRELVRLSYQTDKRIRLEFINPDEALLVLIFKACQLRNNSTA